MPASGVVACLAVLVGLFVFGVAHGVTPMTMLYAIGTLLGFIAGVWVAEKIGVW